MTRRVLSHAARYCFAITLALGLSLCFSEVSQAAITLVGSTSSTTRQLTVPSGVQNGDLLLAFFSYWYLAQATPPAGWTLMHTSVANGSGVETVWYRFANADAPGSTYTWTFTGSGPYAAGGMLSYRGVAPVGFDDGSCTAHARSTTPTLCSFSTTSDDDLLVGFFATENTNLVLPADLNSVVLKQYLNGSYFGVAAASKALDGAGVVPADIGSMNLGGWASVAIALKADASTPVATTTPTATATPIPGAIALIGSTSTTTTNFTVPAGVQNGDLLLAFYSYWSFASATAPSGWTALHSAIATGSGVEKVWYRFANNEVPGSTYTWSFVGSTPYEAGGMLAYRGVDPAPFEDGFCTTQGNTNAPTLCAFANNFSPDVYLGFFATENTNLALPPGLSGLVVNQYARGSHFGIAAATMALNSTGAVPAQVGSMNSGGWATVSLALKSLSSGPAPTTTATSSSTMTRTATRTATATATSTAIATMVGPTPTATATGAVMTDVLTYHNDNKRTGQNLTEQILTPSNVNSVSFGKLVEIPVDGKVDAQPLIKTQVTIPGKGVHNVLYVVTEHDSVYALDADDGSQLWKVSVLGAGELPSDNRACGQITPEIGITSTPVIDPSAGLNGTIYVVAMSKDSSSTNYFHRVHALDLTTGAEEFGGPATVSATVLGSGAGSFNGLLPFVSKQYKDRAGLLLLPSGQIYLTFSSHCDNGSYTGWIFSFGVNPQNQLVRTDVLNVIPNGLGGAIWQAGAGPAADDQGNIYFLDGNGTFDTTLNASGFPTNGDFGNAFIKLSPSGNLHVSDYFAPFDTVQQSSNDWDFGSGGALLLPDLVDAASNTRHLAVGAGKDGNIYIVDRDNMSKFNSAGNPEIYQEVPGAFPSEFAMPAYFNNVLYYGGVNAPLRAYPFSQARLVTTPSSHTSQTYSFPGTTPSISSNGSNDAIIWTIENAGRGVLHAYDPSDLAHEFYNSDMAPNGRDSFQDNKFVAPTIANGKVYVGTPISVAIFGLLPQ